MPYYEGSPLQWSSPIELTAESWKEAKFPWTLTKPVEKEQSNMNTYGVQGSIDAFLMIYPKLTTDQRKELYEIIFEAMYLRNATLTDTIILPVSSDLQGNAILSLMRGEQTLKEKVESVLEHNKKITTTTKVTISDYSEISAEYTISVPSDSSPGKYYTVVKNKKTSVVLSCTCLDFVIRKNTCKHMRAVQAGYYK